MLGEVRTRFVYVHPKNATARGFQQLRGEVAEQAKTDDGDQVAEFHFGSSYAVQCYGSQSGKGCFVKGNFLHPISRGDTAHEQPRHTRQLGVHGESRTGAGDTVAGLQIGDSITDGDNSSGAAVTRGLRVVEAAAHGLPCR
jgi:hypothetical protein